MTEWEKEILRKYSELSSVNKDKVDKRLNELLASVGVDPRIFGSPLFSVTSATTNPLFVVK